MREVVPNLTLNNGTEYHASGKVARVVQQLLLWDFHGEIENLPEPEEGTIYIVSAMVLAAAKEKGRIYRIRSRIRKIIIHYNSSK